MTNGHLGWPQLDCHVGFASLGNFQHQYIQNSSDSSENTLSQQVTYKSLCEAKQRQYMYIYKEIMSIYIYIYIYSCYKSSPVLLPLIMFLSMLYLPASTKPIVSLDVLVTKSSLTPLAVKILSIIPLEIQKNCGNFLKVIYFCVDSYTCHKLFERETLPGSLPKTPAQPYKSFREMGQVQQLPCTPATWRIIPLSRWFTTVVNKSPNWCYSTSKWPFHGL